MPRGRCTQKEQEAVCQGHEALRGGLEAGVAAFWSSFCHRPSVLPDTVLAGDVPPHLAAAESLLLVVGRCGWAIVRIPRNIGAFARGTRSKPLQAVQTTGIFFGAKLRHSGRPLRLCPANQCFPLRNELILGYGVSARIANPANADLDY